MSVTKYRLKNVPQQDNRMGRFTDIRSEREGDLSPRSG